MTTPTPNRVQPGIPTGGQFSTSQREEPKVRLVVPLPSAVKEYFNRPKPRPVTPAREVTPLPTAQETTQAHIETMIARGDLSPAARELEPREAIEQWAQANALVFDDKVEQLAHAGLLPVTKATDLRAGELIDLEPVLAEYPSPHPADDAWASTEFAEILSVSHDERAGQVTIVHNAGAVTVPSDLQIAFVFEGDLRCGCCGLHHDECTETDLGGVNA